MNEGGKEIKKSKTYHFHQEWEEDFLFTMSHSKCVCLICRSSIALPKKGNVERHFRMVHRTFDTDFPPSSELRKRKVRELKSQLLGQQSLFTRPTSKAKAATEASFRVSRTIVRHKKCFQDGVMVKEAFIEASDALFKEFKNKTEIMSAVKAVQLTRNTVTRRCEMMGDNLVQQLAKDIDCCECFSLQMDESTDITDKAQLCIFIRMVHDMTAKEELLTVLHMNAHTRGEDIFQIFKTFIDKTKIPVCKLVSITTDGAPAMVGCRNGFVAKCREDEVFPDFLSYHCIIHQQALCAKMLNMKEIMDVATKVACSIRAKSLQRRLFRLQLEEADSDHTELLLHTDVRWLSRGKFLQRFRDLLPEIKQFLQEKKHAEYEQLNDDRWLLDLAFLTDVSNMLNELNVELQGKEKLVINMISTVNAFKGKLKLLSSKIQRHDLGNFSNLASELNNQEKDSTEFDSACYAKQIDTVLSDFDRRFQDFALLEPVATFMCFPFREDAEIDVLASKISTMFQLSSAEVEDEILTLQADINLKARANEQFWSLLTEEKYPNMRKCATSLTAMFGSTYLCESAFSHMKIIKSKYRSTLTDDHLEACLRLTISSYCPDYASLVDSIQCKSSSE